MKKNLYKTILTATFSSLAIIISVFSAMIGLQTSNFRLPTYTIPIIISSLYLGPIYGFLTAIITDIGIGLTNGSGYLIMFLFSKIGWGVFPGLINKKYSLIKLSITIILSYIWASSLNSLAIYIHFGKHTAISTFALRITTLLMFSPLLIIITHFLYITISTYGVLKNFNKKDYKLNMQTTNKKEIKINIIGAGLSGIEAANYLANQGFKINLYEMRPKKQTEAHKTKYFGELVCSNSFRSTKLTNAIGLLKKEMLELDSVIIKTALENQIKAGSSLTVSREEFAKSLTKKIKENPNINIINKEFTKINPDEITIIAAGPLASNLLVKELEKYTKEDKLFFYDAIAPIVLLDSINLDIAYYKDRYDNDNKGNYLNIAMTKKEYDNFYNILINSKVKAPKEFEKNIFEGCMPIEVMAKRGYKTLLFGPLKPVGLEKDKDHKPYAVIQLRPDDKIKTMYNLVGFQTSLLYGEQKKLLKSIPGLENVEILRYGVIHRSTYINSPKLLKNNYQLRNYPNIYVIGQLSGVEGYVESSASGLLCAICLSEKLKGKNISFSSKTVIGSLANYISAPNKRFVPMNANFGIIEPIEAPKKEKRELYIKRSLNEINNIKEKISGINK